MIKAVPQTYAETRFRSTLEADWAATLDSRAVEWRYEPEAIELPSGALYRPDFWLPGLGCWLEVKGPGVPGAEKPHELAKLAPVILGRPARRGRLDWKYLSPAVGPTLWHDAHFRAAVNAFGVPADGSVAAFVRAPR